MIYLSNEEPKNAKNGDIWIIDINKPVEYRKAKKIIKYKIYDFFESISILYYLIFIVLFPFFIEFLIFLLKM